MIKKLIITVLLFGVLAFPQQGNQLGSGGSGGSGSGSVASSTANQVPVYTGPTTITGQANLVFEPAISTPSAPVVTPIGGSGTTWGYKVVAFGNAGYTAASTEGTGSGGASLNTTTITNGISWTAVPGAVGYDLYRTTWGTFPNSGGKIAHLVGNSNTSFTDTSSVGQTGASAPTIGNTGQFEPLLATLSSTGTNAFLNNPNPLTLVDNNVGISSRDSLLTFLCAGSAGSSCGPAATPSAFFMGFDGDAVFVMGNTNYPGSSSTNRTRLALLTGTAPEFFDKLALLDNTGGSGIELDISPGGFTNTGLAIRVRDNGGPNVFSVDNQTGIVLTSANAKQITSDYTNATATLSTFQSWSILASTNYSFKCDLIWQGSTTATSLKLSVLTPATPTNVEAFADILSTNTGTATEGEITASGGTFTGAVAGTAATSFKATLYGTVENGTTAGTLAIQAADGAGATVTLKRGSYCQIF